MKQLKVMVLEDNKLVAAGLRETLTALGHECISASCVDEARVVAKLDGDIAVALVDAGLQGGEHGLDFLRWLATYRPAVRRILISGSTAPPVDPALVDQFLKKPFELSELCGALTPTAPPPRS